MALLIKRWDEDDDEGWKIAAGGINNKKQSFQKL